MTLPGELDAPPNPGRPTPAVQLSARALLTLLLLVCVIGLVVGAVVELVRGHETAAIAWGILALVLVQLGRD